MVYAARHSALGLRQSASLRSANSQEVLDDADDVFPSDIKLLRYYRGEYRFRWSEAEEHFLLDLLLEPRGSRIHSRSAGEYLEAAEHVSFASGNTRTRSDLAD